MVAKGCGVGDVQTFHFSRLIFDKPARIGSATGGAYCLQKVPQYADKLVIGHRLPGIKPVCDIEISGFGSISHKDGWPASHVGAKYRRRRAQANGPPCAAVCCHESRVGVLRFRPSQKAINNETFGRSEFVEVNWQVDYAAKTM